MSESLLSRTHSLAVKFLESVTIASQLNVEMRQAIFEHNVDVFNAQSLNGTYDSKIIKASIKWWLNITPQGKIAIAAGTTITLIPHIGAGLNRSDMCKEESKASRTARNSARFNALHIEMFDSDSEAQSETV